MVDSFEAKKRIVQVNQTKLNYQHWLFQVPGYSLGLVPLLEPIRDRDKLPRYQTPGGAFKSDIMSIKK